MPDYLHGGIRHKYHITKTNGRPVDPEADYFVLRLDKDPHARAAALAYADSVDPVNSELADDLRKKVNAPRQRLERLRNQGGEARKAWLVMQPCVVCRRPGPNDPAHITTDGMSRKADACFTVSLCHDHHMEFHAGQVTFAARYGIDLDALAARTEALWVAASGSGGSE